MTEFGTFTARARRSNDRAFYSDKLLRPLTLSLTKTGLTALKRTCKRTGRSRGDVYERLLRLHAAELADVPQYAGKLPMPLTLSLTQFGLSLLNETQRRVSRSRGDIFEHLLLAHGDALEFPAQPEPQQQAEASA
jgi:hypothetical protein